MSSFSRLPLTFSTVKDVILTNTYNIYVYTLNTVHKDENNNDNIKVLEKIILMYKDTAGWLVSCLVC